MERKVLDHGYVKLVESWGSEERIIEAARMSTSKGFQGWGTPEEPGDEKLLRYLWEHKHRTPFEMAGLTIEVQAPICVFREWHRHRTQSYNELSARYTPLPDVNYVPSMDRLIEVPARERGRNKQAESRDGKMLQPLNAEVWLRDLEEFYRLAQHLYESGLTLGVPKELARLCVPVGRYSRMRASANLRNWFQFLELRMAPNAQWEIRQYANVIGSELIANLFPRTWGFFMEERR